MNQIQNYIKKSQKKNKIENYLFKRIAVYEKDKLPEHISIKNVLLTLEKIIPEHLLNDIDYIVIGSHPEFKKRKINAFYRDGVIYTTNEQDDDADIIDDIIHELSHSLESLYINQIYGDLHLENEFLGKRKRLFQHLKYDGEDVKIKDFMNPEYSWKFDKHLLKDIGYKKILMNSQDLFVSPYAVTSLREYYATGFDEYFLGDREYLENICPVLFSKMELLLNQEIENET